MERKIFKKLVTLEEAIEKLYKYYTPKPVGVEKIGIERALNRVLAKDIVAPIDVPPFDRSAYDGFAVIASDTYTAYEDRPVKLEVIGNINAGQFPKIKVKKGTAVEIGTGGVIPPGANAVVMVEHTNREGKFVYVYKSVAPGQNIQPAGSDLRIGEIVLNKGTVLSPREIGVIAALGINEVTVFKRPRVAIISTGDEIEKPGKELPLGKIYDINAYSIGNAVKEAGGEPIFLGIARDNAEEIYEKIKKGLQIADVVMTSGSTSAGVKDILYNLVNKLGNPGIIVHGIKISPGKPTIIGVVDGKLFIGLPGYPTSALSIFMRIVAPVIRELSGYPRDKLTLTVNAKINTRVQSVPGRHTFVPVSLIKSSSEQYIAFPTRWGSGSISTLAFADGVIEIPENINYLEEGASVEVRLFGDTIQTPDVFITGSHCLGIDYVISLHKEKNPNVKYRVIHTGSQGGLTSMRRGEPDIAGIHLLDEQTRTYNVPFIRRYQLTEKVVLIKGYIRKQGFAVKKGNPKGIKDWKDLLRDDVTVINRIPGSGTRVLFDLKLRELANKESVALKDLTEKIDGYHVEAKSHNAVGAAIKIGRADVGLTIEPIAHMYNLDFIPVADEEYDFIIAKDRLDKREIKEFIDILRSKEFKENLSKVLPGLYTTEKTGTILKL